MPTINTGDRPGRKITPGFFQGFAYNSVDQGFTRLQVAGRLVDNKLVIGQFLDHEIATLFFNNRRYRDVWFPDHVDSSIRSGNHDNGRDR